MADYYAAWIEIGGGLTASDMKQLVEAIKFDGCGPDWAQPFVKDGSAEESITNAVAMMTP